MVLMIADLCCLGYKQRSERQWLEDYCTESGEDMIVEEEVMNRESIIDQANMNMEHRVLWNMCTVSNRPLPCHVHSPVMYEALDEDPIPYT